MDEGELVALGLYDPADAQAGERLELLQLLVSNGATVEDLVAWRERLHALAFALGIRGGALLTLGEAAAKAGLPLDEMRRLTRAAGIADPEDGAKVLTQGFAELARTLHEVSEYFGEEANVQLLRVLGSSMARIADTAVSLFLVNVEPTARLEDPVLGVARANLRGAELVPLMAPVLDTLFRQHLLAAQRPMGLDADSGGYETRHLAVGFVDLVGSTELGEQLSLTDLGTLLTRFEHLASDTVTNAGGRVIKLIGDEVLFTAPDAAVAARISVGLAEAVVQDTDLPAVRAGLAHGLVMLRDGDVFGPVVNLAARIVGVAGPGEVLGTIDLAAAAGVEAEPAGSHQLKGIAGDVELVRLLGP